ncbi:MAG TPA: hypothetical protein VLZ75_09180 [Chitinophagales bacterium]|nr:hypothetical protein [Chitinophagales bacterium]
MNTQQDDIIQELKDLNSNFLLKNKERSFEESESSELSEDFYKKVMNQIPSQDSKVITLQRSTTLLRRTSIFQIAASIVLLLTVSVLTYTIIGQGNPTKTGENQLQQLLSQTSSQEINDYLKDNGMPADEEFLTEYVNTSFDVSNLN